MLEFILPFLLGFTSAKSLDSIKLFLRSRKRKKHFPQSIGTIGSLVDALKLLDQDYELKQTDNLGWKFAINHEEKEVILQMVKPTIH